MSEEKENPNPPEVETELPPAEVEHFGLAPSEELEAVRPLCKKTAELYSQVLEVIREMKAAEHVLQQYHAQKKGLTSEDVETAKQKFMAVKKNYLQIGNQINEGIKPLHKLSKTYPDDILVQALYKAYLAKLLASLETRNPIQPLIEAMAMEGFEFSRAFFTPTEHDVALYHSPENVTREKLKEARRHVNMLEVRYQKRQLANRVRHGENPVSIVADLRALLERDPSDINTYIWLANIQTDKIKTERNQNLRTTLREEVLELCQTAFSIIDNYLSEQGFDNQVERDKRRAEYVRTITNIRKPLLNG